MIKIVTIVAMVIGGIGVIVQVTTKRVARIE